MQEVGLGQLLQLIPMPSVSRGQEVCHGYPVLPGWRAVDGLSQPTVHEHAEKDRNRL